MQMQYIMKAVCSLLSEGELPPIVLSFQILNAASFASNPHMEALTKSTTIVLNSLSTVLILQDEALEIFQFQE